MRMLNVDYDNILSDEAIDKIIGCALAGKKCFVCFVNADCIYQAYCNPYYNIVLKEADLVLPDGIGVKLGSKLLGAQMKDNCNGTDLSPSILRVAASYGIKVFLLGGKPGRAEKAAVNARNNFGVDIVGHHHGYFDDDQYVIEIINRSNAEVLFVALGVPYQETWIYKNLERLNPSVCLGVGAYVDYLSGELKRAPLWMRKLHLEWMWRIYIEPGRMVKRYVVDGSKFIFLVLKECCSKK